MAMKPNDRLAIAGLDISFEGEAPRTGPNYLAESGRFLVSSRGRMIATLVSEKRIFPATSRRPKPALLTRGASQLYVSLGDATPDGAIDRAALSQAARAADLAWRRGDGRWAARCRSRTDACASARRKRRRSRKPRRCMPVESASMNVASAAPSLLCLVVDPPPCLPSRCSRTRCCRIPRWRRARATLSQELRCMVCQNQSIDDSDALLARDLRLIVRERL